MYGQATNDPILINNYLFHVRTITVLKAVCLHTSCQETQSQRDSLGDGYGQSHVRILSLNGWRNQTAQLLETGVCHPQIVAETTRILYTELAHQIERALALPPFYPWPHPWSASTPTTLILPTPIPPTNGNRTSQHTHETHLLSQSVLVNNRSHLDAELRTLLHHKSAQSTIMYLGQLSAV